MRACSFARSSNVPFFSPCLRSQYLPTLSHQSLAFSTVPKTTIRDTHCWWGRDLAGLDVSSGPKWLRNPKLLRTMRYTNAILNNVSVTTISSLTALARTFLRENDCMMRTFLWWPLRRTAGPCYDTLEQDQDRLPILTHTCPQATTIELYPRRCMHRRFS